MTAYLTEFIVGLLAMAALFVGAGKNAPMVNDVTIGKRFTTGASVYHSDCGGEVSIKVLHRQGTKNPAWPG